jgi:hypothetical protein
MNPLSGTFSFLEAAEVDSRGEIYSGWVSAPITSVIERKIRVMNERNGIFMAFHLLYDFMVSPNRILVR